LRKNKKFSKIKKFWILLKNLLKVYLNTNNLNISKTKSLKKKLEQYLKVELDLNCLQNLTDESFQLNKLKNYQNFQPF
jgi:hypothetical protein